MDSFFLELGRTVRARWQRENFSPACFPRLAAAALEERPPCKLVNREDLMRDFLLEDEQPFQTASGFGQPELVVFDDPRFYIQVLFWLEGTTDIHEHTFSGAFHVMEGSSLQSRFVFEDAQTVSGHLRAGRLRCVDTRLLETGSTVPIESGSGFVHSLFHLEMPSLTVVVRTHSDPGAGPQWTYLPPRLAVDPLHHDALTLRRKQLLDVLETLEDPGCADRVLETIARLDFERGFFILQNGVGALRRLGRWEEALAAFESRHGALAAGVGATLDEIVRRDGLAALRGTITDAGHRFFLALLLNVPDRDAILKLVAARFPRPPEETIARWAEEMCVATESGTWLADAEFPPELEIEVPDAERGGRFAEALRNEMARPDPDARPAKELEPVRAALRNSSWRVLMSPLP